MVSPSALASSGPSGPCEDIDEDNFDATLAGFNGLSVVKFYAPWCRTCKSTKPTFDRMVAKVANERQAKGDVKFFQVNFAQNKKLAMRERVFALPAVHFYHPSLGRVNRFTLKLSTVATVVRTELDRYLGAAEDDAESGHLHLLQKLRANADAPLQRYANLVGLLQALQHAPEVASAATAKETATLSGWIETDERRLAELRSLFDWIDQNGDGNIDAQELQAVAAAVGGVGGGESSGGQTELYETLVQQAQQAIGAADEETPAAKYAREMAGEAAPAPAEPSSLLDWESFKRLMTGRAVTTFKSPESELEPAFKALDKDGDGTISRDEMLKALELVQQNMPDPECPECAGWMQESADAFDAFDVDQSGELDYGEFVALLSGRPPTGSFGLS